MVNHMSIKHFNIPIFIPGAACPFRCIYCEQRSISGRKEAVKPAEINKIIKLHLSTLPEGSLPEVAFFGGNFTGLPVATQTSYLKAATEWHHKGLISGIRMSTRPDYINDHILKTLQNYPVTTIELGAQSMDDEVLRRSGRGHTSGDVENAARMICASGFSLGIQMMIGLPGDSFEKASYTAQRIVDLGAGDTRIYPTLVIRGTPLEDICRKGKYLPLSLEQAVKWSAGLLKIFEAGGVKVIRVGLHPSEGLISGKDLIAGPFHPSFRELVNTEIWSELLEGLPGDHTKALNIEAPPSELRYAIGYGAANRNMLAGRFRSVTYISTDDLSGRQFRYTIE